MRGLLAAFRDEGQTDKWMLADIYYVAAYMVAATGDTAAALGLIDEALQDADLVKNLPHMYELQGVLFQKSQPLVPRRCPISKRSPLCKWKAGRRALIRCGWPRLGCRALMLRCVGPAAFS